ncbi:hypothetical protein [Falsibacillus albus]|nr:hypothetical protein [Falsibacillus albus]
MLMKGLLDEIEVFKSWAETADQSNGEWETEYLDWQRIYFHGKSPML